MQERRRVPQVALPLLLTTALAAAAATRGARAPGSGHVSWWWVALRQEPPAPAASCLTPNSPACIECACSTARWLWPAALLKRKIWRSALLHCGYRDRTPRRRAPPLCRASSWSCRARLAAPSPMRQQSRRPTKNLAPGAAAAGALPWQLHSQSPAAAAPCAGPPHQPAPSCQQGMAQSRHLHRCRWALAGRHLQCVRNLSPNTAGHGWGKRARAWNVHPDQCLPPDACCRWSSS